ncbi:MAG: hypothetical protein GY861_12015 [bacterium]|nr:hypothetical protein [bacterium]
MYQWNNSSNRDEATFYAYWNPTTRERILILKERQEEIIEATKKEFILISRKDYENGEKLPTDAVAIMKAATDIPEFGQELADFVNAALIKRRKGKLKEIREEFAARYVLENFEKLIMENVPIVQEFDALPKMFENMKVRYCERSQVMLGNGVTKGKSGEQADEKVKEKKDNID